MMDGTNKPTLNDKNTFRFMYGNEQNMFGVEATVSPDDPTKYIVSVTGGLFDGVTLTLNETDIRQFSRGLFIHILDPDWVRSVMIEYLCKHIVNS